MGDWNLVLFSLIVGNLSDLYDDYGFKVIPADIVTIIAPTLAAVTFPKGAASEITTIPAFDNTGCSHITGTYGPRNCLSDSPYVSWD